MPYKLATKGDQTCVVKDDGSAVEGGCHASKADAQKHMDALYANVKDAKPSGTAAIEPPPMMDVNASQPGERPFTVVLTFEGKDTSDGRHINPGALTPRTLPLPWMLQTETDEKHRGACIAGRITKLTNNNGTWEGSGFYLDSEDGCEGAHLAETQTMPGCSADIAVIDGEIEALLDDAGEATGAYRQIITKGEIMGGTQTPFPAFADAKVQVGNEIEPDEDDQPIAVDPHVETITAAAAPTRYPVKPPKAWFSNPELQEKSGLHITKEGRVFGHIARWGECHISFLSNGECLTPPNSPTDYSRFLLSPVECEEGCDVVVGQITLSGGHADESLSASAAKAHYDDTNSAVCDVVAGEDQFGIWVSGAMRPNVTDVQLRDFRAAKISGDWRPFGYDLDMVAVCAVNVPGYLPPQPRARVADGRQVALLSAGALPESPVFEDSDTPEPVSAPNELQTLAVEALDRRVGYEPDLDLADPVLTLAVEALDTRVGIPNT